MDKHHLEVFIHADWFVTHHGIKELNLIFHIPLNFSHFLTAANSVLLWWWQWETLSYRLPQLELLVWIFQNEIKKTSGGSKIPGKWRRVAESRILEMTAEGRDGVQGVTGCTPVLQ